MTALQCAFGVADVAKRVVADPVVKAFLDHLTQDHTIQKDQKIVRGLLLQSKWTLRRVQTWCYWEGMRIYIRMSYSSLPKTWELISQNICLISRRPRMVRNHVLQQIGSNAEL